MKHVVRDMVYYCGEIHYIHFAQWGGHDRLPSSQDKKDLPYVNAIMREVMRLNPVVPVGES